MRRLPECVDCKAERDRRGAPYPKKVRPCPYGGPRTPLCHSHFKARKTLAKSGAHERRVQKVYGLKPGEYGVIYLHQEGLCALCRTARGVVRHLAVDHDHASGLVRGLLCSLSPCNKILGHARDDVEFFRRAIAYLVEPPARQLGIVAIHEDSRRDGSDG